MLKISLVEKPVDLALSETSLSFPRSWYKEKLFTFYETFHFHCKNENKKVGAFQSFSNEIEIVITWYYRKPFHISHFHFHKEKQWYETRVENTTCKVDSSKKCFIHITSLKIVFNLDKDLSIRKWVDHTTWFDFYKPLFKSRHQVNAILVLSNYVSTSSNLHSRI